VIYIILFRTALACSFVVSKALLDFVPPFLLAGTRMTIGGTLCLAYVYFFNPSSFYIKKKNVLALIAVIICSGFLTNGLEAWGLSQTIAAKAYFIYNFSPFIAALFGFLFFHEKMTRNKWIGLAIGFVGFIPLIYNDLRSDNILINTLPELAILVAAGAMVLGIVAKKKLVVFQHYSMIMANGLLLFFGGLISVSTGLYTDITLTCLIAYNMYGILVQRYSVTFISFSEFLGIFLVAFLGWAFLGETISNAFWVAFVLVAIGMYVFYKEELRQRTMQSLFDEVKRLK
jgi:drug/metabolite transporter (DMT)-like permease